MNTLLDEYGDVLVACLIAVILFPLILYSITFFYKEQYPTYNDKSMSSVNSEIMYDSGAPEIVAPATFRIKHGNQLYNVRDCVKWNNTTKQYTIISGKETDYHKAINKYKELAKVYEYGSGDQTHKAPEIDFDVYGAENINVNPSDDNIGDIYIITYKATNSTGHTTTKQMKILIG